MILESAALGMLFYQMNESMKMDEKSVRKNVRAFSKMADSEAKVSMAQENAYNKLLICAKRKNAILNCHIKQFEEQFERIRKIEFQPGKGIEELDEIESIKEKLEQNVYIPALAGKIDLTDKQVLLSVALFGIGGLAIKDSEMNAKVASRNMAQANAMAAQADSVCIALNGIAKHTEIVTKLLQRLGFLYIKSIRNITEILDRNGTDPDKYTQHDIDSLNISLDLTKVIYKIINTPIVDKHGEIEQASIKTIQGGEKLLADLS